MSTSKITATPAMVDAHDRVSQIRAQIADLKKAEKRVLRQVRDAMDLIGADNIVNEGDKSLFQITEVNREVFDAEGFDAANPGVRAVWFNTETHTRFIVGRVHKDDGVDRLFEDDEAEAEAEAS
jgi:hypothetical protein